MPGGLFFFVRLDPGSDTPIHFLLGALLAICCTVDFCTARELRPAARRDLVGTTPAFIDAVTNAVAPTTSPFFHDERHARHRSLFILSTIAANVGVTRSRQVRLLDPPNGPGSDMKLSSVYWARKASSKEGMLIAFRTSTFAAWISLGASEAGGSMAHNTKTCRR